MPESPPSKSKAGSKMPPTSPIRLASTAGSLIPSLCDGTDDRLAGIGSGVEGDPAGDNIVWQVDTHWPTSRRWSGRTARPPWPAAENSSTSASPTTAVGARGARRHGPPACDPTEGFEPFITKIHRVIERPAGACFVFDCLSTLAEAGAATACWATSSLSPAPTSTTARSLAYFRPVRNCHSFPAIRRPSPKPRRSSSTSTGTADASTPPDQGAAPLLPDDVHAARLGRRGIPPVTASVLISSILTSVNWAGLDSDARVGMWKRTFAEAEAVSEAVKAGTCPPPRADDVPAPEPHGDLPRPENAHVGVPISDARRCAGHLETHDRHRADRRQVGRHAAGPGDPQAARLPRWDDLLEAARLVLHRLRRLLHLPGAERLLVAAAEAARIPRRSSKAPRRPASGSSWARSPTTSSSSSRTCSTTSASRRSSSARAACWRTTSATPSPASTRASSAPTRGRARSGWRTSSRPCARSTPAR